MLRSFALCPRPHFHSTANRIASFLHPRNHHPICLSKPKEEWLRREESKGEVACGKEGGAGTEREVEAQEGQGRERRLPQGQNPESIPERDKGDKGGRGNGWLRGCPGRVGKEAAGGEKVEVVVWCAWIRLLSVEDGDVFGITCDHTNVVGLVMESEMQKQQNNENSIQPRNDTETEIQEDGDSSLKSVEPKTSGQVKAVLEASLKSVEPETSSQVKAVLEAELKSVEPETSSQVKAVLEAEEDTDFVIDVERAEKICRICHLSSENMELIQLGCGCKDQLGVSHLHCAQTWFNHRGNRQCEICGKTVKNITGIQETRIFTVEWNEMRLVRSAAIPSGQHLVNVLDEVNEIVPITNIQTEIEKEKEMIQKDETKAGIDQLNIQKYQTPGRKMNSSLMKHYQNHSKQ
ncbi:hypothetical protein Acr_13g0006770 [Actinidia rufa]|uniref:RING-CH-type domain-containing protein n=1 Tax=Actinidia rufa TaxID=165716 RepID=A0A7J0FLK6_9ERIC|nr:hypothetical protein Acr_13g0006770 [Actinidia rufa]